MSTITQRVSVQGVRLPSTASAPVPCSGLAQALVAASGASMQASTKSLRSSAPSNVPTLVAPGIMRGRAMTTTLQAKASPVQSIDSIRRGTATMLQDHVVESEDIIEAPLRALEEANSPEEALRAQSSILSAVHASHERLFTAGLLEAVAGACRAAGYGDVTTRPTGAGTIHVEGSREDGAGIETILVLPDDGEPYLDIHPMGLPNTGCEEVIRQFEAALVDQGVELASRRRFTDCPTGRLEEMQKLNRPANLDKKPALPHSPTTHSGGQKSRTGRRRVSKRSRSNQR